MKQATGYMKRRFTLTAFGRRWLAPIFVLALGLASAGYVTRAQTASQFENNDAPFSIQASPSADENLFLIRLLQETYSSWPDSQAKADQLTDWISRTRERANAVRGLVRPRRLDPDVGDLYGDCLALVDAYETFLSNRGTIERRRGLQAAGDVIKSGQTAYQNGSDAQSAATMLGASSDNAEAFGRIAGLFGGLYDFYTRSQQHNEAEGAAIQAEVRKLSDVRSRTQAAAEATVERLTRTHGWAVGEAGFDNFQEHSLSDSVARRPRDPFAKARLAMSLGNDAKPSNMLSGAKMYFEAAVLVPAAANYDGFRVDYLGDAAGLAVAVASTEAGSGGYSAGPTPSTPYALRLARTYLATDPQDATGDAHALLARALALSRRLPEAVEAANTAYTNQPGLGNDPAFCFRYALMMSLTNSLDLAGDWLARAYANGLTDVERVRNAADLGNFRIGRSTRYADLTSVKLTYWVDFGFLLDDIVLENKSPFELTNVNAQVTIRKGQSTWQRQVQCKSIKAGGNCRAQNVVSIPGDKYDEAHATFDCDQFKH
jgi:hypothetical protein